MPTQNSEQTEEMCPASRTNCAPVHARVTDSSTNLCFVFNSLTLTITISAKADLLWFHWTRHLWVRPSFHPDTSVCVYTARKLNRLEINMTPWLRVQIARTSC